MSVGVRGLRVGTGPRGHYVNVGYGGIYYRSSVGHAGQQNITPPPPQLVPAQQPYADPSGVQMVEIESGNVMEMREEAFSDLIDEINKKQKQVKMAAVLMWAAIVIGVMAWITAGPVGILAMLAMVPAYFVGKWLDSYRRSLVLFYDLDERVQENYEDVTVAFDTLASCGGKWHVAAGGNIRDMTARKRNAGASRLVDKKPTTLEYALPSVIKSNITPPALHVGKQIIYFFPDVALVQDGAHFGAVGYPTLSVEQEDTRFIETDRVPKDAQIVGHTWMHPNKSGGPDRRFKNNRQLPICLYETMLLTSRSGVNEAVQFSRCGVVRAFASGLRALPGQAISHSSRG